jgi:hypothetical protein
MTHTIAVTDPSATARSGTGRKTLALRALAGRETIAALSRTHGVSRPFVYEQKRKAETALAEAFARSGPEEEGVLFYLPVTKTWLRQLVLGLILICHGSLRSVIELLRDLLDVELSVGGVHNIVAAAIDKARVIHTTESLGHVRVGAHDEIFQGHTPVLVGIDAHSTYCYLLAHEPSRDADTWGVRLLELSDKGLRPERTVADGGLGLRAGQALAWPHTPCDGDVFHAEMEFGRMAAYQENRAWGALTTEWELQRKMRKAKRRGQGNKYSKRLTLAADKARVAVALADTLAILSSWLRDDIFAISSMDYSTRRTLLDFVIAELRAREDLEPHRIRPLRTMLQNHGEALLAFARQIDEKLHTFALKSNLPVARLRELLGVLSQDPDLPVRGRTQTGGVQDLSSLRCQMGDAFAMAETAVRSILAEVVRASSMVENFNSRLRNYFFLRKSIGPDYLILLRFFLNHRRFMRSECPQRVGKSPAELLTRNPHPHWLEMLGYQRFRRAA